MGACLASSSWAAATLTLRLVPSRCPRALTLSCIAIVGSSKAGPPGRTCDHDWPARQQGPPHCSPRRRVPRGGRIPREGVLPAGEEDGRPPTFVPVPREVEVVVLAGQADCHIADVLPGGELPLAEHLGLRNVLGEEGTHEGGGDQ